MNEEKVIIFIELNGWKEAEREPNSEFRSFYKENNISIDISSDEVVLLNESGDFKNFNIDNNIEYTLLGYFILNRYLDISFKYNNKVCMKGSSASSSNIKYLNLLKEE